MVRQAHQPVLCLASDPIAHILLFPLTAEPVLGAVEEALDVRLVLHNDEHGDNHGENHLPEVYAFKVVFRAYKTENGQEPEKGAPENASDGDVFRRDREDDPKGKCRKHRERQNRKKDAERCKYAFASAEPGKASKAVSENHEKPCDKWNPGAVVSTAGGHLGFAHFLGDEWSKKAL